MRIFLLICLSFMALTSANAQGTPGKTQSTYDRIVKVTATGGATTLELNNTIYGSSEHKKFLAAVSDDPIAHKMFKKAFDDADLRTYSSIAFGVLSLGGLAMWQYSNTLPNPGNNTQAGIAVGLLFSSLIPEFMWLYLGPQSTDEYYAAINQYNRDVLDGAPKPAP